MKYWTVLIVGIAVALGSGPLTSVQADPFTLCVREGNGKMNRGAFGEVPAKGGCRNENKWSEVTLVQESNLSALEIDLQGQIDALDLRVDALEEKTAANMEAIMANDNEITELQTKTGDNMAAILVNSDLIGLNTTAIGENSEAITELDETVSQIVTSSMIGGDMDFFQQVGPGSEIVWQGMFRSNIFDFEEEATQTLSATGTITNFYARSSEPDTDNTLTLTLRINESDTPLTCSIAGAQVSCSASACVSVAEGQRIAVKVDYDETGDPTSIFDVRWNSRFVENGVCDD